jgi:alpha/beta superfamily hydrolase
LQRLRKTNDKEVNCHERPVPCGNAASCPRINHQPCCEKRSEDRQWRKGPRRHPEPAGQWEEPAHRPYATWIYRPEERVPHSRTTWLFAYTAARLADSGIASLRIDFNGSGERAGTWEETTFSGQIKDAVLAFDYVVQAIPNVDVSKVGILGYSQGGLVGGHLAAVRPEAAAVVLWAPTL